MPCVALGAWIYYLWFFFPYLLLLWFTTGRAFLLLHWIWPWPWPCDILAHRMRAEVTMFPSYRPAESIRAMVSWCQSSRGSIFCHERKACPQAIVTLSPEIKTHKADLNQTQAYRPGKLRQEQLGTSKLQWMETWIQLECSLFQVMENGGLFVMQHHSNSGHLWCVFFF